MTDLQNLYKGFEIYSAQVGGVAIEAVERIALSAEVREQMRVLKNDAAATFFRRDVYGPSKRVSPFSWVRPLSGLTSPAIVLTGVDLLLPTARRRRS